MSLKIATAFSELNNDSQGMLFLDGIEEIEETFVNIDIIRNLQISNLYKSEQCRCDQK